MWLMGNLWRPLKIAFCVPKTLPKEREGEESPGASERKSQFSADDFKSRRQVGSTSKRRSRPPRRYRKTLECSES